MLRWFFNKKDAASDADETLHWKPSVYYHRIAMPRRRRPWRGPNYQRARERVQHCSAVLALLHLVARANAPMDHGLEAAAIEYRRHHTSWSRGRLAEFSRRFLPPLLLIVLAAFLWSGHASGPAAFLGALCLLSTAHAIAGMYLAGRFDAVLLRMRDDLRAGLQLSESMRRMDRFFPPGMADRVAIAEATGQLAGTLEELDHECAEFIFRASVTGVSRYYVTVVLAVLTMIAGFCLIKIVPVFVEILRDYGQSPPAPMRLLMATGDFVIYNAHYFVGMALFMLLLISGYLLPRRNGLLDHARGFLAHHVPPISIAARPAALARIASMLSVSLRAGMPLPRALDQAATGDLYRGYRRALEGVRKRIENGDGVGEAFDAQPRYFPTGFRVRVHLGEDSGLLPEALDRLAEVYRRRAALAAQFFAALAQVCCILGMGALVFLVWSACLMSLTAMSDAIATDF